MNLLYLNNKIKKSDEPKIIKYNGMKVVGRDKMGTRNMYEYNNIANTTAREKSLSPLKVNNKLITINKAPLKTPTRTPKTPTRTPIKNQTALKTPIKNSRTANKSTTTNKNQNNKTPIKSPITTRKY